MMTLLKKKYCILLTATIAPENVPNLIRSGIALRENDYIVSLRKWFLTGIPLVFVENSSYVSEEIDALFASRNDCEYLSFITKKSQFGKSHGEAEIMDYAFVNSKIIQKSDVIVKVTGRLFVKNALSILSNFDKMKDIGVMCWFKENMTFADSRFFIGQKLFYDKYLLPELITINEEQGIYFEHVTARATCRCMADGHRWHMFYRMPILEGYSGTEGVRYRNDVFRIIKRDLVVGMTNFLLKLK